MIKAVFFDIDGTLIPHGQQNMPKSTLMALEQLKQKGIKVFIATGRPVTTITHALSQFDFDGYLALNGQYCYINGQVVRDCYIAKEDIAQVIPYLQKNKISCIFAEKDYVYVNLRSQQYLDFHRGIEDQMNVIDDVCRHQTHHTYQLMVFISENEEKEFFQHLPNCKSARWHPMFADVIPQQGGKDQGIKAMAQYLNISHEEVMAFGDGGNDIDMLKCAGIGVAMGNGSIQVKANADYVTSAVDSDGIALALKHFKII